MEAGDLCARNEIGRGICQEALHLLAELGACDSGGIRPFLEHVTGRLIRGGCGFHLCQYVGDRTFSVHYWHADFHLAEGSSRVPGRELAQQDDDLRHLPAPASDPIVSDDNGELEGLWWDAAQHERLGACEQE